jgi:hypothetical protein
VYNNVLQNDRSSIAEKPAFFAFGGSPMKFGALTAALLPKFQMLPFSNKLPLIVLKLAL